MVRRENKNLAEEIKDLLDQVMIDDPIPIGWGIGFAEMLHDNMSRKLQGDPFEW